MFTVMAVVAGGTTVSGCGRYCKEIRFPGADTQLPPEASLEWSPDLDRRGVKLGVVYEDQGQIESYAAITRIDDKLICLEARQAVPEASAEFEDQIRSKGFGALGARLVSGQKEVGVEPDGSAYMVNEVKMRYQVRTPPGSTSAGLDQNLPLGGEERLIVVQGVLCFRSAGLKLQQGACMELRYTALPAPETAYCWKMK